MSVFFLNTCKFGCGKTFSTLQELIYHIEDTHLDFEPKNGETEFNKQTTCMPVSYIFRLFSGEYTSQSPIKPTALNNNLNVTLNSSRKDSGSEFDEENYESESEKSIDSWSNNSIESDSNTILKIINTTKAVQIKQNDDNEKPYICQFTDCKKRYRNSNGLKYHTKSVHTENGIKKEPAAPRMYRCLCNKNYKTPYGLKNHAKTCEVNLSQSNSIKLTELKATVVSATSNGKNGSTFSSLTPPTSKPTISVSIATTNVLASPPKINDAEMTNLMQDDQFDELNKSCTMSIKAPTLQQHLLSPIEAKSTITSQS